MTSFVSVGEQSNAMRNPPYLKSTSTGIYSEPWRASQEVMMDLSSETNHRVQGDLDPILKRNQFIKSIDNNL
ncbi:hypothetical protein [Scytonema sp. PCC 10023]|uniref:hypothetical protein n=1 Tax=Scytonema sp. PCC 10023 TaxID=1680591 RepID=UPI0039C6E642